MQADYDLCIIGGGLVGASLALALQPLVKQFNWKIALIESQPPQEQPSVEQLQPSFDARNTALAWGTRLIYEELGLWNALAPHAYPIQNIQITNKGYLGSSQLKAQDQDLEALGYVVPNLWLGKVLWDALPSCQNLNVIAPAQIENLKFEHPDYVVITGQLNKQPLKITSRLVVLAEGGRSNLKHQLGIQDTTHDYQQSAVIARVTMSRPHAGWAYERFSKDGAMALLPLVERDMALVWTRSNAQAEIDASLNEADFLNAIQAHFGASAGRFEQVTNRFTYPLKKVVAQEHFRRNLALLGNTAHYLHPVAGQGYNLAIRGALKLVQALEEGAQQAIANKQEFHPGNLQLLHNWQQNCQADQAEIIGFSHSLIELFGKPSSAWGHLNGAGLIGFNLVKPLKNWVARKAMGL